MGILKKRSNSPKDMRAAENMTAQVERQQAQIELLAIINDVEFDDTEDTVESEDDE